MVLSAEKETQNGRVEADILTSFQPRGMRNLRLTSLHTASYLYKTLSSEKSERRFVEKDNHQPEWNYSFVTAGINYSITKSINLIEE